MSKRFADTRISPLWRFLFVLLLPVVLCCCAKKVYQPAGQDYPPSGTATSPRPSTSAPAPLTGKVVEKPRADLGTPRTITHEVGPMETIWRISRMYNVSAESIYAANGLKPGEPIDKGRKLVIPNARTVKDVFALYPNSRWKYIIVHHTATDIGKAILIDRSHADRGFWYGLGYHFLIDNGTLGKGDGQIEAAPRWVKQQNGAHCKAGGMNEKGIGISLVGNFNEELPTSKQLQALEYLLKTLMAYYRIPAGNVIGHRDVEGAATDCPGRRFPWPTVRQALSTR
jgi:N-acetylmuramoyl-L-alanine amidase